jgi:hypothetical protein
MKLVYKTIFGFMLLGSQNYLYPQSVLDKILENVSIRKSFETKTDSDDKPANLASTFPKEGENFFSINAGIGYSLGKLFPNAINELSAFFVYNKNNQIDKEQENYKFGFTHFYQHKLANNVALINNNSIEYLNDNHSKIRSLLVLSYLQLYNNVGLKLNSYGSTDASIAYKLTPKIGLEYQYQSNFDSSDPMLKGYNLRSYFNAGGSLLIKKRTKERFDTKTITVNEKKEIIKDTTITTEIILPKRQWKRAAELTVNYEGRNVLADNFDDNQKYLYFFKGEVNLYPINSNNLSVGISYNKGQNPIDGLEKQEFWMLSFNYKK